jgi:peptidoglycan hydrolase-like protein with peptidoglycan-binding domain
MASTGGRQEPFTYGSLPGEDIYFVDPIRANQVATNPVQVPDTQSTDMIVNDFKFASQIGSAQAWDAFVKKYENRSKSFLVGMARKNRKTLEAKETKTAALNLDSEPDPSTTLAAPPEPQPSETEPAKPALSEGEITLRIQRELQRLGCNPGTPDGVWGRKSKAALGQFAKYAKVRVAGREPTQEVLSLLQPRSGRVCPFECGTGFLNVNGVCMRKTCPSGKRLSSKGVCYTPRKTTASKPATQRKVQSPGAGTKSGSCFTFDGKQFCE